MNELEKVLTVAKNEIGYVEKGSNSQLDNNPQIGNKDNEESKKNNRKCAN